MLAKKPPRSLRDEVAANQLVDWTCNGRFALKFAEPFDEFGANGHKPFVVKHRNYERRTLFSVTVH
jgi:hypothetical protein